MKKWKCLGLLMIVSIFILIGCNQKEKVKEGLVISSIQFGLGGELDETLVSYKFSLWNNTSQQITVKSIQPLLTDELNKRVTSELINVVNLSLYENSSTEISGSFYMDTQGLDKQGIIQLNIKLDTFRVTTEQDIGR